MSSIHRIVLLLALSNAGCGEQVARGRNDAAVASADAALDARVIAQPDAQEDSAAADGAVVVDPLAAQADVSEGLVNVASDLDALLEYEKLRGACAAYQAGQSDRATLLRCGKWQFFWEGFGTVGVPKALAKFLIDNFPEQIGRGFSKLGMIEDPTSADYLPLGMAPGAPLAGGVETLAFTCASCHFGRLPDGRYAVGAPNHDYDYARQNLSFILLPTVGLGVGGTQHDPAALALVQPLLDKLAADPTLQLALGASLLPLITSGAQVPAFTPEVESAYASWQTGTMDFFIAPLPFDDKVHTISKISALWGLPDQEEAARSGMTSAMLGMTGSTTSLANFAHEFVDLGGGKVADWPDERLAPLVAFIYSLRAPANPVPPPAEQVKLGAALFQDKGCIACHAGPRGGGKRVYTFEEIGTDPQIKKWADPKLTGQPCCNLRFRTGETLTHGIKSPRLTGSWAFKRFLHNGAVPSLEALFCLGSSRPTDPRLGHGDQGHDQTCSGLSDSEKRDLIGYLRAR